MVLFGFFKVISGVGLVVLFGVKGLVVSLILSAVFNALLYMYNLKDILLSSVSLSNISILDLIKDAMPFYLESYLMYFRAEGDQLIVTTLLGAESLAIYFIAKKPFEIVSSFTQALDKVLTVSLSKCRDDLKLYNEKVNQIFLLNAYILFPIIFVLMGLSPFLIQIIAGSSYEAAVFPSIILLLCLLMQFYWRSTFGRSIFLLQASSGRLKVTLFESVTLIILITVLGRFFEIHGIVVGRLIATVLAGVFAFLVIKTRVKFQFPVKNIIWICFHSLILGGILLVAQYFTTDHTALALSVLTALILFLALIHLTISESYYEAISQLLPFRITDPVSVFSNKLKLFFNNKSDG